MTAKTAEIIYVDFKTKQRIQNPKLDDPEEEIKVYDWVDSLTGAVYTFDSRVNTNEPMVEIPLWLRTKGGMKQIPVTFSTKELIAVGEELTKIESKENYQDGMGETE